VGAGRQRPREVLVAAAEHEPQRAGGEGGAEHLRQRVGGHLAPREAAAGGEGEGDGRVEVRAGDVAHGVHHHHHRQAPHDGHAGERDLPALARVDGHRAAPGEDEEVGAQDLGQDLSYTQSFFYFGFVLERKTDVLILYLSTDAWTKRTDLYTY
jgi:hypothetical protein